MKLRDEHRDKALQFDVGPGDGVYFPSTSPHMTTCGREWTSPGDRVSVSIGINFYTDVTRRAANVHAFNQELRRLKLSPLAPGRSALLDRVKHPLGRSVMALRRLLKGVEPPAGFR